MVFSDDQANDRQKIDWRCFTHVVIHIKLLYPKRHSFFEAIVGLYQNIASKSTHGADTNGFRLVTKWFSPFP